MITELLNDDGTVFDPPVNPLKEKWDKLYPPTKDGQPCWGHRCMFCHRCPMGDYWKCPDEDRDIYDKYLEEYWAYMRAHNPSMFK